MRLDIVLVLSVCDVTSCRGAVLLSFACPKQQVRSNNGTAKRGELSNTKKLVSPERFQLNLQSIEAPAQYPRGAGREDGANSEARCGSVCGRFVQPSVFTALRHTLATFYTTRTDLGSLGVKIL